MCDLPFCETQKALVGYLKISKERGKGVKPLSGVKPTLTPKKRLNIKEKDENVAVRIYLKYLHHFYLNV